ncbi:MAG: DNA mismatch repair endonuclease MutL [Spirochaetales bacterium]|nr:DNA mismatch repair endonuclease MutL [Spirochaetales bacterium]
MLSSGPSRRIHILREADVRKIAAGEVIDRPLSVIRELLDNAIDAGADAITVEVDGGGIERIRVVDNGTGMSAEDLELCILPHATSKITRTEDIYSVRSLGFRGEALASIAACSKLEITSTHHDSPDKGARIIVHAGKVIGNSPAAGSPGTTVEVSDLFYSLPGRRKFLKRVSSESSACKQAFIEKALPFPSINFRYFTDGEMKLYLPAQDLTGRVASVFAGSLEPEILDSKEIALEDFSLRAVITNPDFARRDKRLLYMFVNGRRVQEYALVQAVLYGYSEHLAGGNYPAAFLFLDVNPELLDFNIHPAKREVRFKNLQVIHRATVDLVRSMLSGYKLRAGVSFHDPYRQQTFAGEPAAEFSRSFFRPYERAAIDIETVRRQLSRSAPPKPEAGATELKYHGQLFGLFLLVERNQSLYIIDQHAAHERIIYEKLVKEKPKIQNLLVPLHLDLDEEEEEMVERDRAAYEKLGFTLERQGAGSWLVTACPAVCLEMKDALSAFIKGRKGDPISLEQALYATVACRSAVMDGELVDDLTGSELARQAFELEDARCPHGRPIWVELSRSRLFEQVKRT